ncbi:MAG: DNRLRE domain-containing protein, partial [Bacteroidetes bacterium]|nr:DNRLRE domain-containing protein [Bacteroidota bacterium]
MKNKILTTLIAAIYLAAIPVSAQVIYVTDTIYVTKDAMVSSYAPDGNYGNNEAYSSYAWTSGGAVYQRGYMEFNLDTIPENAVIIDATLILSGIDHSGANISYLECVTAAWEEAVITWNNQPATDTNHRITLAQTTSSTENKDVDMKYFVQQWLSGNLDNYGIRIKLETEAVYRKMRFASSDYTTDTTLRPYLIVTYSLPVAFTALSPDKDALICDYYPTTNLGTYVGFAATVWTFSGTPAIYRSLMELDVTGIPADATITRADLYLYGLAHDPNTHSNASYMQTVTSSWTESTVTWNTAPSATSTGQLSIPGTSGSTENDTVDIKTFTQDWVDGTTDNYGMMMLLQNETPFAKLYYGSSDNADSEKHPKVEIEYTKEDLGSDPDYAIWFKVTDTTEFADYLIADTTWFTFVPDSGRVRFRLENPIDTSFGWVENVILYKDSLDSLVVVDICSYYPWLGTNTISHDFVDLVENEQYYLMFSTEDDHVYKIVAGVSIENMNTRASTTDCGLHWEPLIDATSGVDGTNGNVSSLSVYDDDLFVGGAFSSAGGQSTEQLARWDGSNWTSFQGFDLGIWCSSIIDGEIYFGGQFSTGSGIPSASVVKYNGTSWTAIGSSISSGVGLKTIVKYDDTLYTGGYIYNIVGSGFNHIAKFNGTSWQPVGTGANGAVQDMLVANGLLYAAGYFEIIDGVPAIGIAAYDGNQWTSLNNSGSSGLIHS